MMNLDNRCKIVAILGLSFLLILISANASMAKTLYDNFPNDYISKTLWKDFNTDGNDTNEFVREVNSSTEVLVLKLGTHETYWPVRNALPMVDPDSINAIKADVKIVAMNNDPSDSATVFARIGGIFYNKNSATPSDGVGDIWAELCLGDRGNGLESWVEVSESIGTDDWSQQAYETLVSNLSLDTFYTLELSYDGNNTISFSISGPGITKVDYSFTDDDPRLALSYRKFKGVNAAVHENFGEFVNGYVHAEVDNVYINGSGTAYDTFEPYDAGQNRINPNKWQRVELVKEAANGRLRLGQRDKGDKTVRNRVKFRDRYADYVEAKVRIESGSYVGNDVNPSAWPRLRARIAGYVYNQSGNYNGYQDDVWMYISLQLTKDNTLAATALLAASNVDETNYTELFSHTFPTVIQFDTDYILSFSIVGNKVEFKCNNDSVEYDILTPVFEASDAMLFLESRLDLGGDAENYGWLKTQFDEVYVSDPVYDLTGDWIINGSNEQLNPPGCTNVFNPPVEEPVTMTQNGCEISMTGADIPDGVLNGVVSGTKVLLGGMSLEDNDTVAIVIDSEVQMTSSDSGSGTVSVDSSEDCEGDFDIKMVSVNKLVAPTIVTGDLNNDGQDDLAGVTALAQVRYTTNLTTWTNIPGELSGIVTGDLNGDGNDDLAGVKSIRQVWYTTDLSSWTNIPGTVAAIVTGDFDNDGNDDIAGINPDGVTAKIFYTTDLSTWTTIPGALDQITSGDLNADGNDDLAGVNRSTGMTWYTTDLNTWTNIP